MRLLTLFIFATVCVFARGVKTKGKKGEGKKGDNTERTCYTLSDINGTCECKKC